MQLEPVGLQRQEKQRATNINAFSSVFFFFLEKPYFYCPFALSFQAHINILQLCDS